MRGQRHSDETRAVIYGLRAVNSLMYFYVGSTKHSAAVRFRQHLDGLGRNGNRRFVNKIRTIGRVNVCCDVLDEVAVSDRWDAEYGQIAKLRALGHPLVNVVTAESYSRHLAVPPPSRTRRNIAMLLSPRLADPKSYDPRFRDLCVGLHESALKIVKCILDSPEEREALGL